MAKYYSKTTLKQKVAALGEAIGTDLKLLTCDGKKFAVVEESNLNEPFAWAGWYRPIKDLIIYIDGLLNGIDFMKEL